MQDQVKGLAAGLGVELSFTRDKKLSRMISDGKIMRLGRLSELAKTGEPVWVMYKSEDRNISGPYFATRTDDGGFFFDNGTCGAMDFDPKDPEGNPDGLATDWDGEGQLTVFGVVRFAPEDWKKLEAIRKAERARIRSNMRHVKKAYKEALAKEKRKKRRK